MSKNKIPTLDEAVEAVRTLPQGSQDAIVQELVAMVEDYQAPGLTDAQRDIVTKRLAEPRSHIPRDDFLAMLRRYNPAL